MPYAVFLSKRAAKQLHNLERYLANRFYPVNAALYIQRILAACESLSLAPHKGTKRDDIRPGIRVVGFERRVDIHFKVVGDSVFIIDILYAGRSPSTLR